jgi:hypothetical protein
MFRRSINSTRRKKKPLQSGGLTPDEFMAIATKNCHYCGEPPRVINYIKRNVNVPTRTIMWCGVDRVDSSIGYTGGNCVPCCKRCNVAKNTMTQSEFLAHVSKIYEHSVKHSSRSPRHYTIQDAEASAQAHTHPRSPQEPG